MNPAQQALDALTLTLPEVATALRAGYPAVRSWRLGNRHPGAVMRGRLVRVCRKQAGRLLRLAARLEQERD
jgi:hypothetical protein